MINLLQKIWTLICPEGASESDKEIEMDFKKYIDSDLLNKFEFYNYGHALEILHDAFPVEWNELQECLRRLKLTVADIKKAGGNESPIPKKFDDVLYPYGWLSLQRSVLPGSGCPALSLPRCCISPLQG